jgi:hypothetical protein
MRRIPLALSLAVIALLIAAAGVAAQDHSASDEYTENIPGVGGDSPSSDHTGGGGGVGGEDSSPLAPAVVEDLNASGADGQGAAALAEETAPAHNDGNSANGTNPGGRGSSGRSHSDSGGGIGGVVDQVVGTSDSGGMGIALPIILGAALVAAFLFLLARHRGPGEPGSA